MRMQHKEEDEQDQHEIDLEVKSQLDYIRKEDNID
jgi:hypothetical protein